MECGEKADYIITALDPSFRYYDCSNDDSTHVIFNTRECRTSDLLKGFWLAEEPTSLILPTLPCRECDDTMYVDCDCVDLNEVKVFSRQQHDLAGTVNGTEYDLRGFNPGNEDKEC